MELPELPISANCVRVPVMVGHAEAVWVETESPLSAEEARGLARRGAERHDSKTSRRPGKAAGVDDVLVGRIRQDPTESNGLVLFLACDNLRKGAALNAIQIAELLSAAKHWPPDRREPARQPSPPVTGLVPVLARTSICNPGIAHPTRSLEHLDQKERG